VPIENAIEVVILQHPQEQFQAKGTAKLLDLCLKNSHLEIGETFEPALLDSLTCPTKTTLLLFPNDESQTEANAGNVEPLQCPPDKLRLIVIDGTWRKARKMMHLNPALAQLPRLSIAQRDSQYLIRKTPKAGQLSTLEAAYWALEELGEPHPDLLNSFRELMAMHMKFRPPAHTE